LILIFGKHGMLLNIQKANNARNCHAKTQGCGLQIECGFDMTAGEMLLYMETL